MSERIRGSYDDALYKSTYTVGSSQISLFMHVRIVYTVQLTHLPLSVPITLISTDDCAVRVSDKNGNNSQCIPFTITTSGARLARSRLRGEYELNGTW